MSTHSDLYVVGGGIAGLATAIYAARGGRRVTLLEGRDRLGGRARSRTEDGFVWNIGPHALYRRGAAQAVLDELGIDLAGRPTAVRGSVALREGRAHALPAGPISLLASDLTGLGDKLQLADVMRRLPRLDPDDFRELSFAEALTELTGRPAVRELLLALGRLTTYCHAPQRAAATPMVRQLQLALDGGVRYEATVPKAPSTRGRPHMRQRPD